MSVDILAIGNNNRKKQEQDMSTNIVQPAWIQKEKYYSENMMDQPEARVTVNPLDRQVEIGVGAKITPMSKAQKQQYADSLSDYKRAMMQRYKAEGYSFEASKELVNQMDELANPNARGIDKYKDYEAKEQYYNRNGGTVDPDSTLYKVGTFLQKIGFNDQEKNPLNKLSQDYMQWYANEREAVDTIMEDEEANLAERFGWWLQRSLLSAEAGIIGGIGKIGNAVTGVEDIKQSAMTATLDRLIKGYDTDLDFYREDDRRLDEYLWEGASGGLNTLFWAWAPKIMTAFSALGETKAGEWTMEKADGLMKKIIGLGLKVPGISDYYKSLDEQGQEDMLDTLTTLGWMELAKRTGKWTGKMKISRKYQDIKNQFKVALDRGIEGAKEQAKAEVKNVKEATDLYNEGGKKIGSMGPEGEVGAGKSVSRIVKKGVDEFKQSFIDRYNARHGGTVAEPGAEIPTEEPVVGKPNNESKGVVDRVKDVVDTKITGLTPEERIRVVNDPYTKEKREKARNMLEEAGIPLEESFITEQLYNEVGDKILQVFDEWENKLQNTLPEYRALRELNTTYNLIEATPLLTDLLLKNDITQDPVSGELDFSNSKFVSDADMRSVQRAIDMIYKDIGALMTPRQYLNLRDKLDQLAKYTTMDASRGQSLIRQIRRTLDGVAKKQIPGLKELDDTTSKYFKEIAELKDGWVYKESTRKGQVRNNFYSIIKNLTGHNRKVMLQRLEKYYPGIGEEIEAIHIAEKLVRLYNKSPQMIKALGIGGGLGGLATGSVANAILWSIFGALIEDNIINPMAKSLRRKKIDKLLSELSPEAKAKLEEIALRQTYAKEMSEEDKRVLEGVAEIIRQENERGLSEEAIRERERRTKPLDQEALPGIQPDIVDENGNITLGRGNVISPDKGPGRARRLTRINEINLRNPESTPDKQVLDLQEKLDIDTDVAREIQSTIDDFLKDVGADEEGAVGGREVNYEKFTTRSLEKLMDNENLPRTEKDKIKDILAKRGAEEEAMSEVKADRDFATRIKQLSEEEQRIGKVGKNKVSKEVADKQTREWEKKKEALIKEMQDYYGIDQFEASDKYLDMEAKGDQYIREYKRSNVYKTETAEREVLDSLMEGWSKQPKFVRDMTEEQLSNRQDLINNIELQNGYKLETTNYNDRYLLERDGNIVDKGAIKYLDDGRIEVTAQTIDGLKSSGLLDQLPENAVIKVTGEELSTTAGDLRGWEYQIDDLDNPQRITSKEAMQLRDIRGKTAQELADDYGLTVDVVEAITTPDGRNALGRVRNGEIEILENPDISTIHHEIFHPVFNMVDPERRVEIMEGLKERKGLTEGEAKEWLAENFSEYARTGEFDKTDMPKTFRQKIKAFFKKVLDRIKGIRSNKEQIKELYDDILDGKIKKVKLENGEYEYQVEQKSLFDQEKAPYDKKPLTPEEQEHRAGEMLETWGHIVRGFDIEAMSDGFSKDIAKRTKNVEKATGNSYGEKAFIDYYLTLKALQGDPDFIAGLKLRADRLSKAKADGQSVSENIIKLDKLLSKPLELKKGKLPISTRNEELIEPIRRWLIQHGVDEQREMDKFKDNYSPDTIYWKQKMQGRFRNIPLSEFKELEEYAGKLVEDGEIDYSTPFERYSNIQVNGMNIDRFIDTIGNQIGNTFAETRIKEVAKDMWDDVMDPMGDIFRSALAGATEPLTPTRFNEFAGHIYYDLGQTYTSDIKEWSKAVEEEIKAKADRMGISLNRKKVIPEAKLQNLGAKLKELLAIGQDVGEYLASEKDRDYNPTRNEWIRDLVNGAYENAQRGEAQKDIETTKQLVALSNMDVDKFKTQIEKWNGKNPMPSIAVTDVNVPHTAFGELTLVFGRDTVDPQVDERNKLYASDAWTPTFPDTETAGGIHYEEATELIKILKDKINEVDKETLQEGGLDPATIDNFVHRIANEIMSNGTDEEYLRGRDDVAERSVEDAIDDIGLERADNEGLFMDLERIVSDYVKNHQIEERIPGRYFKGRVRYQDFKAINEIVDKVYDNLPEKGKQKLKDDGWNFDETDSKYVINQKYNDTPPKQGLERDLLEVIEKIEDRPNNTPTEAGREYRDLLVDEYGFDRSLATQIAEDIFGRIEAERLTPEGFAEKLADYMPLNDGDMGFDFGEMDESNLDAMNGDVASMNRQVGRRILEERDGQKNNVDGPQAMNKIIDTLLDEREENTHEIIENYVVVDLREKAIGEDPSFSEEDKRWQTEGKKQTEEIMGGVDASLTDMKLWVKDIANQEMLIEELNRDRPLTPENIVEAMRNQGGEAGANRTNAEGTLRDLVGVEGKKFTDIEQVRGKNLAKTTHNDRTGDLSAIEKRYDTIIDEIRREFTESEPDIPTEMSTQVVRQEIAWNYDPDLETFRNNLEEENPMWEIIPDDYLQAIIDAVEMGKQVPVRFSESKPERVVDMYKEVKYVLVPERNLREVNYVVKGTPLEGKIYPYDHKDFKDSRSRKLKSLQRKYGDIFFSMGGVVMPIAMLYLMMEQEDEGQA